MFHCAIGYKSKTHDSQHKKVQTFFTLHVWGCFFFPSQIKEIHLTQFSGYKLKKKKDCSVGASIDPIQISALVLIISIFVIHFYCVIVNHKADVSWEQLPCNLQFQFNISLTLGTCWPQVCLTHSWMFTPFPPVTLKAKHQKNFWINLRVCQYYCWVGYKEAIGAERMCQERHQKERITLWSLWEVFEIFCW